MFQLHINGLGFTPKLDSFWSVREGWLALSTSLWRRSLQNCSPLLEVEPRTIPEFFRYQPLERDRGSFAQNHPKSTVWAYPP